MNAECRMTAFYCFVPGIGRSANGPIHDIDGAITAKAAIRIVTWRRERLQIGGKRTFCKRRYRQHILRVTKYIPNVINQLIVYESAISPLKCANEDIAADCAGRYHRGHVP